MRGGKREGSGRPAGRRNKITADIKALAQVYAPGAVKTLAEIMAGKDQPAAARVAAARELIDRGYGKALQAIDLSNPDGTMRPMTFAEFYAGLAAAAPSNSDA